MLSKRTSVKKAALSGVALAAANKFVAGDDLNIKGAGLQAACSYIAPSVSDSVAPMIKQQPGMYPDAIVTGAAYFLSSYAGDYRQPFTKFLYSAAADVGASYVAPMVPL